MKIMPFIHWKPFNTLLHYQYFFLIFDKYANSNNLLLTSEAAYSGSQDKIIRAVERLIFLIALITRLIILIAR